MTAKQYLMQIKRLDKQVNNNLAEIYQLKSLASSVSIAVSEDRVQTSTNYHKLDGMVAKIVDLERETQDKMDLYLNKRKKIISQIEEMDDTMQYQVLYSKYVEYKTFEKIAEENSYSFRQIFNIHGTALNNFEEKFLKKGKIS